MILRLGARVFWGAPEVIYLEGLIVSLNEQAQTAVVHIDRTTPHSAHLIGTDIPFAANGIVPMQGASPPGTTTEHSTLRLPPPAMDEFQMLRAAAATAIHQQYGYTLPTLQEEELITHIAQALSRDPATRTRIIASMNEILRREW